MFNKIMKRGGRKVPKSDENDHAVFYSPYRSGPGGPVVSTSNVTVNHTSRPASYGGTQTQAPIGVAAGGARGSPPQIENLPLFRDVPVPERPSLFVRKLQICSFVFEFSDTLKFAREKETKRQTLLELVDFIQSGSSRLSEPVQEELILMVGANIFRCLPPASHENTGSENADPEEEDPYLDPTWPHLQIVYELLLHYIVSSDTDTKIAKRYIDHSFVLRLLDLFDSEDPRERDYLKTILHRIYGKFMVHRPFVRKAINNIFYRFILETERHNGIAELLEILGSIINGFAVPMKEEHKLFLIRALIPLHKPKSISLYHQQLSYCITQFVEKDYKLADTVIRGLLKYWPVINCQKEVLFLGELEEVLEATHASEFHLCMVPLFKQIARCLNSPHFQVHSKRRNRLHQKKMNDLVFVMYNKKLMERQDRRDMQLKEKFFNFEDIPSDDEWITEKEDPVLPRKGNWLSVLRNRGTPETYSDESMERNVEETTTELNEEGGVEDLTVRLSDRDAIEYISEGEWDDAENASGDDEENVMLDDDDMIDVPIKDLY